MSDLAIFNHDGKLYTDSREVAKMIGKDHAHLMRDIDGYISVLGQSKIGFSDFFVKSTYRSSQNKELPCYNITKKGCEFVANKLTGNKGITFTAIYVNAFHAMEDKLSGKLPEEPVHKKLPLSSFNHLLEINVRQMKDANVDAKRRAVWVNSMTHDALASFGIDVPMLATNTDKTYNKEQIAKALGVYSKAGKPHSQAIAAIIRTLHIGPELIEHSPFAANGHSDDYDRFKAPVLDKVRKWLDTAGWPNPIVLGKKYNVVYKGK